MTAAGARFVSRGADETLAFGEALAAELLPSGVLLLSGDLGSGKTVLARGVARGLGIDPHGVLSPTFNLIREHAAGSRGVPFVHVDLYRLEPDDVPALGLEERLAGPGVKVVEWAERLPFPLPGARSFHLRRLSEDEREIVEES